MRYMKTKIKMAVTLLAVWCGVVRISAVEGLKIQVQGSDVILNWPSVEGETFLITYRSSYETNSAWGWLATNLAAATGTNQTTFIHTNGAECSGGGSMAMTVGGGSEGASSATSTKKSSGPQGMQKFMDYKFPELPWNAKVQDWVVQSYPGLLPKLPWSEKAQEEIVRFHAEEVARMSESGSGMALMSGGGGCIPAGFYKVVRFGVSFEGITNGMIATDLFLVGVEVGHLAGELLSLSLMIDGNTVTGLEPRKASVEDRYFVVDTGLYANGEHQLHARATFFNPNAGEDEVPYFDVNAPSLTVSFTNAITFEDWSVDFGFTNWWFTSKSTIFPANYEISIYDAQTNLLRTLTGQITNELIDVPWNLKNSQGQTVTNDNFVSTITVSATNPSVTPNQASKTSPPKKKLANNWVGAGQWVIARQLLYTNRSNADDFFDITDSIVVLGIDAGIKPPVPPRTGGSPWYIHYTNHSASVRSNDWKVLKEALAEPAVRNWYYLGHGGGSGLGNDFQFGLLDGEVGTILKNYRASDPNRRPLRFVWLDGCSTASGAWAAACGIEKKENVPLTFYTKNGKRPGVLCGFANPIYANNPATTPGELDLDFAYYRSNFAFYWEEIGSTVIDAHAQADALTPETDPSFPYHSELKIYGYGNLKYAEYNNPSDWP